MNGVRLENILVAQEFNIQTVVHSEEQNEKSPLIYPFQTGERIPKSAE